jgi:ketosteroid isomerase-like protein
MDRGDETPGGADESPGSGESRDAQARAEIERAEARAAERARREERRRRRAERKERRGRAKRSGRQGEPGKPGWRERLAAAARKPEEETREEVIQRRVAAVAIIVVAAVVIMALTDAAPFFDDTSEEERVSDAVERFFAAYGDGDHETMCELFSPDVKNAIETAGATETKGEDPESCAEILAARVGTPGDDEKVSVKVNEVRVSGPRAIANIVLKTPDSNRRQIEAVELVEGEAGWLLTSPVVTN